MFSLIIVLVCLKNNLTYFIDNLLTYISYFSINVYILSDASITYPYILNKSIIVPKTHFFEISLYPNNVILHAYGNILYDIKPYIISFSFIKYIIYLYYLYYYKSL